MSDPDKWYRSTVPELQVGGAASGDPDAMYHLAQRYRRGKEIPQDIPQAVEWLLRAADLGHAHARLGVGMAEVGGAQEPVDRPGKILRDLAALTVTQRQMIHRVRIARLGADL